MNKPWLTRYPEGMPFTIDPSKYSSLASMFESVCETFSSKPAFSCMGKNISYSELEVLTRQLASYFQNELKLKKGDRIAIMSPNLLQYPVALFAALRSGLTVVNVNPLYTAPELKHQLNDSGTVAIIVVANFASVLEEVVDQTNIQHIIVTEIGDMLGSFR
ncbi:MAG TPA: long-chain-fatty-acid--CoA ligase, partial [Gammaproteobacteria bacterium]|nr:long-chain-fatty-acid--CoA ligase [Gammaproteobacteria bacterium]